MNGHFYILMLQVRCRAFQSFSRAGNFVKWPFTVHAFLLLPAPSSWFPAPQTTSWSVCTLLVWTVNRENCIKGGTDHPQTISVVQISWKILHWMNMKMASNVGFTTSGSSSSTSNNLPSFFNCFFFSFTCWNGSKQIQAYLFLQSTFH